MESSKFDPASTKSFNQKFREKRFEFFRAKYDEVAASGKQIRILDIGGMEVYWKKMGFPKPTDNVHITLVNLFAKDVQNPEIFTSVKGDATNMPEYKDGEFDIVFSNSVIEHLYTKENQQKMADEIRRVGKTYYVQTPNYYFPIEPHWLFPCFQFFPYKFRVFLTKNFSLGHVGKMPTKEKAEDRVSEVRLLTEGEMKKMFPDGKVYRERFMGMKKSVSLYKF